MYRLRLLATVSFGLVVSIACGGPAMVEAPPGPAVPPEFRGHPGFDTRDYPGDAVMAAWRAESPYGWVGYYLPSPCYTGTTWSGRHAELRRQGWGMAVLYVGEQDWAAMGVSSAGGSLNGAVDSTAVAAPNPRCTRANLDEATGRSHGAAAAAAVVDEGFPLGSIVFLDVERVGAVSVALSEYVQGWLEAVVADGRVRPGLYVHRSNAAALLAVAERAYRAAEAVGSPSLWVAGTGGFDLSAAPGESGISEADIWQGVLDAQESWGGTRLRIDRNVADRPDPSAPRM